MFSRNFGAFRIVSTENSLRGPKTLHSIGYQVKLANGQFEGALNLITFASHVEAIVSYVPPAHRQEIYEAFAELMMQEGADRGKSVKLAVLNRPDSSFYGTKSEFLTYKKSLSDLAEVLGLETLSGLTPLV